MTKKRKNADLTTLSLADLQAEYERIVGEPTKLRSKARLIERIEEAKRSIAASEGKEVKETAELETPEPEATAEPPVEETETPEAAPEATPEADAPEGEKRISKMTVDELRAKHLELLGRETKSSNRTYLVWRVSQAAKGKIPTGPRARRGNAGPHKVLPMRVPEAAVAPLKDVQKKLGICSRNEMFNRAMAAFLVNAGESTLAEHFGATLTPTTTRATPSRSPAPPHAAGFGFVPGPAAALPPFDLAFPASPCRAPRAPTSRRGGRGSTPPTRSQEPDTGERGAPGCVSPGTAVAATKRP